MGQNIAFILTLYFSQAVAALVLTALFARFYRIYQRPALLYWAWSFAAATLYVVGAGCGYWMALEAYPSAHPLRLGSALLSLSGAYVHLALLGLGALALLRDAHPRIPLTLGCVLSGALIGVISALAWAWTPEAFAERLFLRIGLRYLLTGLVFASVGAALLLAHLRQRESAQRVVGMTMLLFGIQALHVFAIYLVQYRSGEPVAWAMALGSIDLLAMLLIGMALLIWLLDRERLRSQQAQKQIERLVRFDPLTGLLRREALIEYIEAGDLPILASEEGYAVFSINLERFSLVNDSVGHASGDRVLIEVGTRLAAFAHNQAGIAARLDGDRFAMLLPHPGGSQAATELATRLQQQLGVLIKLPGHALELSTRIGIALYPNDGETAEALLRSAELASRRTETHDQAMIHFASAELNAHASERLQLQLQLRNALKNGEFEVYYQPQVALSSRRIVGFEALLRWNHPRRGMLTPDYFLDALTAFKLMHDVDLWVIHTACRQLAQWQSDGHPDLQMAVNVSPASFHDPGFGRQLEQRLRDAGVSHHSLEVEITEATALADVDATVAILAKLRELGVRIALDDFGVGHSSLSQLRRLPVDTVKIDRSFVRDLLVDSKSLYIVNAVLALAQNLRLGVIAEGVESEAQALKLLSCEIQAAQGYHFWRPIRSGECSDALRRQRRPESRVSAG